MRLPAGWFPAGWRHERVRVVALHDVLRVVELFVALIFDFLEYQILRVFILCRGVSGAHKY